MEERYARLELVLGALSSVQKKRVSIVGLGALGTAVAALLAKNGCNMKLIDADTVEVVNLSSQLLYGREHVGLLKVDAAKKMLQVLNEEVTIDVIPERITKENVSVVSADVVVDCTDNMAARFVLDDFCREKAVPLVHGAVLGERGSVFVVRDVSLRSLYPEREMIESCADVGVTNMVVSVVAALQVQQVMNILLGRETVKGFVRVDTSIPEIREYEVKV